MSDELEDIIKSMPLKSPSADLDSKIEKIIVEGGIADSVPEKSAESIAFPWRKVVMYGVAAALFLSIGIAELYKRSQTVVPEIADFEEEIPKSSQEAVDTYEVSTRQSSGNLLKGDVIELEDGSLVRPVIRQITVRKTYFDKEKNVEVEIEEPRNEIYYIPLKSE